MKRLLWIALLMIALIVTMAACGGGVEAPAEVEPAAETSAEEPVAEVPTDEPAEADAADEPAEPVEDEPAAEEAPAEADAGADMLAGRPASGMDPETNLEINPAAVVPGVDFIVRGEIVNANLTPQESPEFVIIAPSGTRFRIQTQPVSSISYEDGTVPALHEFQRGVLIQATVRQEEGAGATITVQSEDFTLLHDE